MVTACSARSPLAGCLANGLVTFSGGRKLSGKDWATSASENPGRLATINLHSLNNSSDLCHWEICSKASMPIKKNSVSLFFNDALTFRMVSMLYFGDSFLFDVSREGASSKEGTKAL